MFPRYTEPPALESLTSTPVLIDNLRLFTVVVERIAHTNAIAFAKSPPSTVPNSRDTAIANTERDPHRRPTSAGAELGALTNGITPPVFDRPRKDSNRVFSQLVQNGRLARSPPMRSLDQQF